MLKSPEFHIFLAHNSVDKPQVRAIAEELRKRGFEPWLDEEQIAPGELFQEAIQRAIPQIESAAICIGSQGLGKWQVIELQTLISQFVNKGSRVIPVLLSGVDKIPDKWLFLREFNWISCESTDEIDEIAYKLEWGITGVKPQLKQVLPTSNPLHISTPINLDVIPNPPAFYAEPSYIGTHEFIGRKDELDMLNSWANPSDPHPILLLEAIGGTGKSILTWQWTTKHANTIRDDWAGIFWYSFYERGAIMADFCRRALAYMTSQPIEDLHQKKTSELSQLLLRQLNDKPFLFILDGLERVLVAYHRFDAAQLADEEAGTTDKIAQRDPCDAIRPEDDDFLKQLTSATPSKLLLTTRLTPRNLLNCANNPIPGVLRKHLLGLRPPDAETLLRNCGVTGKSHTIQNYLERHCKFHPLVTGVIAGLVNNYLPQRGNFDVWEADPEHGGHLNLANLNLVQKRNHILNTALDTLPKISRQLISTLALLFESADAELLTVLNPHLTSQELTDTVLYLERRGLLQYDSHTQRYDLHPVVRGTVKGRLQKGALKRLGEPMVDYFSQQSRSNYKEVEKLEEVRYNLLLIRTLLQMERYRQASEAYSYNLSTCLLFNLEANSEILALLQPFFPDNWDSIPEYIDINPYKKTHLLNGVGLALNRMGQTSEALAAFSAKIVINLHQKEWAKLRIGLANISEVMRIQNRLARVTNICLLTMNIASLASKTKQDIFMAHLAYFKQLAITGHWVEAEEIWQILNPMGRQWSRTVYRPGIAESHYAEFLFWQGKLTEEYLAQVEQLAETGKDRSLIRSLHCLRGQLHLEQRQWKLAEISFEQAVSMMRQVGQKYAVAEVFLALSKFHLESVQDPLHTVTELANSGGSVHRPLAELCLAVGSREQALQHAVEAYKWAWADGEPHVRRYELNKTCILLEQLNAEITPPPYDPTKDKKFPWEDEITAVIDKLRT